MAAEGEFPKVDGDVLYASEANLFKRENMIVYAGSGFDSSTATASPDEQSHELTALTAAQILGADYLEITIVGTSTVETTPGNAAFTKLKIQTKEVGGSYSDSMSYKTILQSGSITTTTTKWVHTLTAGEKSNGVQVKIFSYSDEGAGVDTTFVNIQTVVKPI